MSIWSIPFSVYERLASAKMNALTTALNSHTHNGTNGVAIPFSYLDGSIAADQFIDNSINGSVLIDYTVTAVKIANKSITIAQVDNDVSHASSLKLSDNGYAVYAP